MPLPAKERRDGIANSQRERVVPWRDDANDTLRWCSSTTVATTGTAPACLVGRRSPAATFE